MVDSALIWISLTALMSSISMIAFVLHYAQANKFDFMAFATAVAFGGFGLELGMANGYLPESQLFTAIGSVCIIITVVAGAISIQRQQRGFQIIRNDTG